MSWIERREPWSAQGDDARSQFDMDYARIVHSASFRRLQGKTQILNLGDSDFYRTRLTHSLEVAQIAGGIVQQLNKDCVNHEAQLHLPDHSLIQTIGFAHDLGHPPFGHGGEVALNYCMQHDGGFEGNGQTLRILSKLETFSKSNGANLTRRTLLGLLKYPVSYSDASAEIEKRDLAKPALSIKIIDRQQSKPPKCFLDTEKDLVRWILEPLNRDDRKNFLHTIKENDGRRKPVHKSFDCTVMDVADDIAYGVHDLEDAIELDLISENDFRCSVQKEDCIAFLESLKERYSKESVDYDTFVKSLFKGRGTRKRYISRLVHHFIVGARLENKDIFSDPLLKYRVGLDSKSKSFLDALTGLVQEKVIKSPRVQQLEFKGQQMVVSVFEALHSDPKSLVPSNAFPNVKMGDLDDRYICDYIAAMTDGSLLKTYERLFSPRMGSVFDRL
ncbi:MAG: dNTP triphosphohydrolase [Gammaproteobacteria bacterium]|nr:dNTP triphosphohydrolase [Gammaproteobacteria bacterium]